MEGGEGAIGSVPPKALAEQKEIFEVYDPVGVKVAHKFVAPVKRNDSAQSFVLDTSSGQTQPERSDYNVRRITERI